MSAEFPQPILIGGSARTGTTAMGRLISAHPRYHRIEVEARFHCARGGLCDVLEGTATLEDFLADCRTKWWRRGIRSHVGLQSLLEREQLERALADFVAGFEEEPWGAGRRLVHALLDPAAERIGKPAWVDGSGSNIARAPTLHRLLPEARFIHMVRDGRAVTASILRKRNMTDDRENAFNHWASRVMKSDAALRQVPEGTVLTVFLDDLTAHDREPSYRRLVDFLELDHDAPVRRHFEEEIRADRAHVGRWRERIAPADARWIEREYRRRVREMQRQGVTWLPDP